MAGTSRSARGELNTVKRVVEELIDDKRVDVWDCGFSIDLDNGLRMSKAGYGSVVAAELAGKATAKHYGIDLSPKRKMKKRGAK